jgi:hypothetical protein
MLSPRLPGEAVKRTSTRSVLQRTRPQLPLALNEQHSLFKLDPSDVGLLGSMLEKSVQFEFVQGDAGVDNGALLVSW